MSPAWMWVEEPVVIVVPTPVFASALNKVADVVVFITIAVAAAGVTPQVQTTVPEPPPPAVMVFPRRPALLSPPAPCPQSVSVCEFQVIVGEPGLPTPVAERAAQTTKIVSPTATETLADAASALNSVNSVGAVARSDVGQSRIARTGSVKLVAGVSNWIVVVPVRPMDDPPNPRWAGVADGPPRSVCPSTRPASKAYCAWSSSARPDRSPWSVIHVGGQPEVMAAPGGRQETCPGDTQVST